MDDSEVHGVISANELNRISLINDEIVNVRKKEGGFTVLPAPEKGEIYIRVIDNSNIMNFFIESKKGYTYNLLLTTKEIPTEQIFIKNPKITKDKDSENIASFPYKQDIIEFYKDLKNQGFEKGTRLSLFNEPYSVNQNAKLASKVKINKISNYEGDIYQGEIFEITNISPGHIVLSENDFKRKNVMAIKLDQLRLVGRGKTYLYVITDKI
jgi:hypothetical protein